MGDNLQIARRVLFLAGCVLFSALIYLVGVFSINWLANQILMAFVDGNRLSEGWSIFFLALLMTTLVPYAVARFALSAPNYKSSEIVTIFFCLAVAIGAVISILYLIFVGVGLSGNMRLLFVAPVVHAFWAITGAIAGGFSKGLAPAR